LNEISAQSESLWGISIAKSNISLFGYNWQGKLDQGCQTSEEAIRFAERSGDIYSKSIAYSCYGWSCFYRGRLEEAERYLTKACGYFEKIDIFSFWALAKLCLGLVHFESGDFQRSIDSHQESISLFRSANIFPSFINFNEAAIMRGKIMNGERDVDFDELPKYEARNRFRIYEVWIPALIAEVLLTLGDVESSQAERWITKALEADRRNGMQWNLGKDHLLYAHLCKCQDRREKEKEHLSAGLRLFEECGAEGDAARTKEALSLLSC